MPAVDDSAQLGARRLGRPRGAGCDSSCRTERPRRADARSAMRPEHARPRPARAAVGRQPSRPRTPASTTRCPVIASGPTSAQACPPPAGRCRVRTDQTRCTTVTALPTARSTARSAGTYGTPSPARPVATSDDDQPLGALDQADVRGQPDALGAGLGCRRRPRPPTRQTSVDRGQQGCRRCRRTTEQRGEDRRRRPPGRGWSRGRRPRGCGRPASRAIFPSSRSEKHEHRDHERAQKNSPTGIEDQRAGD